MPNAMNIWIREALDRLREDFGGCCQKCGSIQDLEFAHVRHTGLSGRSRGRKERYYDIKNNRACYMLLCRSCHREHDRSVKKDEV